MAVHRRPRPRPRPAPAPADIAVELDGATTSLPASLQATTLMLSVARVAQSTGCYDWTADHHKHAGGLATQEFKRQFGTNPPKRTGRNGRKHCVYPPAAIPLVEAAIRQVLGGK